jgi:hypothetical protein
VESPKSSSSRAMTSGILNRRFLSGTVGNNRAKGFPLLVISTCSPSAIHADTSAKRFRKSLTVAVFFVIQMCITGLKMSNFGRLTFHRAPAILSRRIAMTFIEWHPADVMPVNRRAL